MTAHIERIGHPALHSRFDGATARAPWSARLRMRNARLAGGTLLLYIATHVAGMFVYAHATGGADMAARLSSVAQHAPEMWLAILLSTLKIMYALILAVTLYALTRGVDPDIALLACTCRIVEGVLNVVPATTRLGLLAIATARATASSADAAAQQAQAVMLVGASGWSGAFGGTIFAVGSTLFAYLFLRGRGVPAVIAWLGVAGSLLVLPLPLLQSMGLVGGTMGWLTSIPILLFEITLALWLLIKGVRPHGTGAQQ